MAKYFRGGRAAYRQGHKEEEGTQMPAQGHQGPLTPNHQGTAPTHEPFLHFCYEYTPVVGSSPFLLKGHFTTTSSKHLLLASTHSCHYLLPLPVARSPSSSHLPALTVATLQPSRYKSSDGLSDPSEMPSNAQRSARPSGNQLLPQFPPWLFMPANTFSAKPPESWEQDAVHVA